EAHRYLCTAAGYRDAWNATGHEDEGVLTFNGFTTLTRLPASEDQRRRFVKATARPIDLFGHYVEHVLTHRNYRIDWILVRGEIDGMAASIDARVGARGLPPSDHYPVIATLAFRSGKSNR